ncbi:RNA polymerase sigma factor [bacterium]|nr:RNA polymerase sigma factor [bacterium]
MDVDQSDLAPFVERAREGEEEACRILMEGLYPTVIRIVRSHLPVRQSEEDLAQEVFVRIFNRLDRYQARKGIPITHWVSRVARTTCLDTLRAERRRPELRWADLSEDQATWLEYMVSDEDQTPQISGFDTREFVEKILAQISTDDRMILNMLYLEDRSVKDISQLTGWTIPGVKVRAFRARRRLHKIAKQLQATAPYEKF